MSLICACVASSRSTYTRPSTGLIVFCRLPATVTMVRFCLDDLEVARELPIGDRAPELTVFPFAARREMLDERVAEQRATGLRLREPFGSFGQGARQRSFLRKRLVVGITFDHRIRLDAVLDAVETRAQRDGDTEIWIDVRGGDPVFDALGMRAALDHPQRGSSVLDAPGRRRRRPESRNQSRVAVDRARDHG